jgi:RNA polymerase sigma-70 factor (ECF subfamily)
VRFRVSDPAAAEDVVQEVFVSAWRSLPTLRRPGQLRVWLFRIAHNRVLNYWRDRDRRPVETELSPMIEEALLPEQALRSEIERRLSIEQALAAIDRLTPLQQQVITLRFIAGLTAAETAEILGRSENAVHNLQHHALAALRRHVGAAAEKDGTP